MLLLLDDDAIILPRQNHSYIQYRPLLIVQIRGEFEPAKKKLTPRKIQKEYLEHPMPDVEIPADCHVLYTVLQINKSVSTNDVEGSRLAFVCPFLLDYEALLYHGFI